MLCQICGSVSLRNSQSCVCMAGSDCIRGFKTIRNEILMTSRLKRWPRVSQPIRALPRLASVNECGIKTYQCTRRPVVEEAHTQPWCTYPIHAYSKSANSTCLCQRIHTIVWHRRLKQGKTPRCNSLINRPCPPRVPQTNINRNQICQQRLLIRIWCITYMNNLCPPKTGPRGSMKHSPTLKYRNKGARSLSSREKTHKIVYNMFKPRNLSRENVLRLHLKCIYDKKVLKQVIYMIKKNSCHIN